MSRQILQNAVHRPIVSRNRGPGILLSLRFAACAGALLAMLGCADIDWTHQPAPPVEQAVRVSSDCVIERHVQIEKGRHLVTWVMRPPGEGPFPVLVWNHGSRIPPTSWFGWDRTQDPTIDFETPCRSEVTREKWMLVFPEGRGYGGSDGPLSHPGWPTSTRSWNSCAGAPPTPMPRRA